MKNILYITYDGLLDTISQSQVLPYLKKIAGNGLNITILSFEKKEKINKKNIFNTYKKYLKECKIIWIPLRYHKSPVIPATILDIMQGIFFCFRNKLINTDCIIHTRGYIAALIGFFLKYITHKKIIFDMRGFWPDEKVDAGCWNKNGLLYYFFKKIEAYLIKNCDEIIVLTEAAKQYLYHNYSNISITTIPCCVDTNLFKPDINSHINKDILSVKVEGRSIIIYLGSLGTFYNFEEMINFFKIFKKKKPNAFFLIVTPYAIDNNQNFLLRRNIDSMDYLVINLYYKDIPYVLSKSDVSIIFYRRHLSRLGCFPVKFAESLSCGLPVVINSCIGDTEEILRKEKVGVVVDDFSNLAYKKITDELIDLLSEGNILRQRCRLVAKKFFSLEDGVKKYEQVYKKC